MESVDRLFPGAPHVVPRYDGGEVESLNRNQGDHSHEYSHANAEEVLRTCPEWFHSIELTPGIVTPGRTTIDNLEQQLQSLQLPDLAGKSVLDIGAYDGFFSFAVERLGAARVTSLDHYVWSTDMVEYMKDWRESAAQGAPLPAPHESRHWHPDELPGRRPFDAARGIARKQCRAGRGRLHDDGPDGAWPGQFDVVLFLGTLYHMEEPLTAIRRLASVTARMAWP